MALVTAGLMNKQIAAEIGIAEITVKIHRGHIMRKMAAKSLPDLVRMAEMLGIGPGSDPAGRKPKYDSPTRDLRTHSPITRRHGKRHPLVVSRKNLFVQPTSHIESSTMMARFAPPPAIS